MTASEREKEILAYWESNQIFQKSVEQRPREKPYTFYDGPPFATGLPHYGHIIGSLIKDVVPRYWTMRGYRVERVWGWDCHGLPIENIIEEKLQLTSKKDIEEYGVAKFNEACRETNLQYADEWKKTIKRMGRWVDMDHAYKTMDPSFMESVWWVFKELWEKDLIYEGKKAMHICPRCVTVLSNFEVTLEYKQLKDLSATVKFLVTNANKTLDLEGDIYVLAWTTTPWTLPGNVLLAVNPEIQYSALKEKETGEILLLAKERVAAYKEKIDITRYEELDRHFKGSELVDLTYEPLFPYFKNTKNAFRVVAADFVAIDEGTGVVHIAPAFGEDDYQIGLREEVEFVQHVTREGRFTDEVLDFVGQEVKSKEDPSKTDIEIIKWLAHHNRLFYKEKYEHSYPHCWRCDTPLLNYATSSWFVRVTDIRDDLLKNNEQTTWVPEHIKEGRFGKWLENARDWAISRSRFWGTPLPVWKSEDGETLCVGSIKELEQLSGKSVTDLHKHIVDEVVIEKGGKRFMRIPEVLDCWFESGSMPYGQMHYPFENKETFERGFPADFIAEGQDQTRGWFYTLHVLATALTRGENPSIPVKHPVPAFKHVVVNGIVLAEDGKKMAKKLKNYPDPLEVLDRYGADAMRYYLITSPAMHGENLNFSEAAVREIYNKIINTLWNTFSFYTLLFGTENVIDEEKSGVCDNVLDRWIVSRLETLIRDVTHEMNECRLAPAARPILDFIADLSQWYIRRSRDRMKDSDDKETAGITLATVLVRLSHVLAPFTPFIAEEMYRTLTGKESVHLAVWPEARHEFINTDLEVQMERTRKIVEMGHAVRAEAGMKVRQPLASLAISDELSPDLCAIIAEEVNVKEVVCGSVPQEDGWLQKEDGGVVVGLDTRLNDELKKEGLLRDITRQINALRKSMDLTIHDTVILSFETGDQELQAVLKEYATELQRAVVASSMRAQEREGMTTLDVGGKMIRIHLEVV